MDNLRKHGTSPFDVAVVHGGPGAPGEIAPVARVLAVTRGVLEPLQTRSTLEGQCEELGAVLERHGRLPMTLVGHSWGAMLCFILTARKPSFVRKLVLVGSAVFDDRYAGDIMTTRLSRLTETERAEFESLSEALNSPTPGGGDAAFARMGELMSRADSYDAVPYESEVIEYRYDIYRSVWQEAVELRRGGKLLEMGKRIECPVVAIHGDYDPHPPEGVRAPLSGVLTDFRFILLEDCGHLPWLERGAKERFYEILWEELREEGQ